MERAEFNALHMPALEQNEVRHNLLLGLMSQPSPGPAAGEMRRWTLDDAGACAIQTAPIAASFPGELEQVQCRALAEQVYGSVFAGAIGPENAAHWFAERAIELGLSFSDPLPQMIHELREPPVYSGAPARHAAPRLTIWAWLSSGWPRLKPRRCRMIRLRPRKKSQGN